MRICLGERLADIQTGNPYKGRGGLVHLGPEHTTMDVAGLFPFHKVDVLWSDAAKNIRSHLLGGQIRVGYDETNHIAEIEILASEGGEDENWQDLLFNHTSVFGKTLAQLKQSFTGEGYEAAPYHSGFMVGDGAVFFYAHDFSGDWGIKLDGVILRFQK